MKRMGTWRVAAIVALGGMASSVAFAQAATDCSSVTDDKSRLKCYDDLAKRQKAAPAAPVAPAASTARPAPVAPAQAAARTPSPAAAPATEKPATPTSEFGLGPEAIRKQRDAVKSGSAEPEHLVAVVKSVTKRLHGEFRITMEDGQVWQEVEYKGDVAPVPGETVTIKRAVMGSYLLSRAKGRALRVNRVQ